MKDVLISTVYDNPAEVEDTILRTAPPTVLKHRARRAAGHGQTVKVWQEGGTLKAENTAAANNSKTDTRI